MEKASGYFRRDLLVVLWKGVSSTAAVRLSPVHYYNRKTSRSIGYNHTLRKKNEIIFHRIGPAEIIASKFYRVPSYTGTHVVYQSVYSGYRVLWHIFFWASKINSFLLKSFTQESTPLNAANNDAPISTTAQNRYTVFRVHLRPSIHSFHMK